MVTSDAPWCSGRISTSLKRKEQKLMSRRMRTYFYAILGGIGGLIGWQVSDLLGLSFSSNLYLSEALVGALIGLSIGFFIGLTEGLLTRNPVHAAKAGIFSGLLGLIAGAIGLPLSEFLF